MSMMGCNKKCFNNKDHPGLCAGLREVVSDGKGGCKFQKENRNDRKNYIPVRRSNGLIYFKEVKDDTGEA